VPDRLTLARRDQIVAYCDAKGVAASGGAVLYDLSPRKVVEPPVL
jgi:hypothetical protein